MQIGDRIKKARKGKKMSQTKLAEQSGMSMMSIRRYESGERKPRVADVQKIANELGVSPSYLLFGDDPTVEVPPTVMSGHIDAKTGAMTFERIANDFPNAQVIETDEKVAIPLIQKPTGPQPTGQELRRKLLDEKLALLNDEGVKRAMGRAYELNHISNSPEFQRMLIDSLDERGQSHLLDFVMGLTRDPECKKNDGD